jgi:hypothetical protein
MEKADDQKKKRHESSKAQKVQLINKYRVFKIISMCFGLKTM